MPKQNGTVSYLDGIRGIAAFLVFIDHFALSFYPAYWSGKTNSHLNGFEIKYALSYFSFITQGGFYVAVFFVLSGFVLSRKYFVSNDLEVAISGFHRRFIRLYIPVAFTLIISFLLLTNNLYFNKVAGQITQSEWWQEQWTISQPLQKIISSLAYDTMFSGESSFDTCLWTMSYEFYGSLFVFAFLVFTHFTRFRIFMMFLAMYYFYMVKSPFYMAFILGTTLCYTEQWVAKLKPKLTTVIAIPLLLISLLFGTNPVCGIHPETWLQHLKNIYWDYTPWCFTIGAYLLVLSYVLSPFLQKIVSIRFLRFLGYISFSLYLLHPLIVGSFSAWLFLKLNGSLGYNHNVIVVFISTTALTIIASWLTARYIDQYGIHLAKKVYGYVKNS